MIINEGTSICVTFKEVSLFDGDGYMLDITLDRKILGSYSWEHCEGVAWVHTIGDLGLSGR